ncbi:unnamed protein product, partial [Prorocentrum cordatum]
MDKATKQDVVTDIFCAWGHRAEKESPLEVEEIAEAFDRLVAEAEATATAAAARAAAPPPPMHHPMMAHAAAARPGMLPAQLQQQHAQYAQLYAQQQQHYAYWYQ